MVGWKADKHDIIERFWCIMSMYLYETHLHTMEASACSMISGKEQARAYKKAGYSGIVVTDHFFNGNTSIPDNLPWEERVNLFYKGYESAKREGDKIGLSVFFAWESNYDGTEFIVLGLGKDFLLDNPDYLSWSIKKQYENVKEAGGYIIHAHPFRIRSYIKEVRLFPEYTDAVEVVNIGNGNKEFDNQALEYARKHNFPAIAGTDSHGYEEKRTGIAFNYKIEDNIDLIEGIRSRDFKIIPY